MTQRFCDSPILNFASFILESIGLGSGVMPSSEGVMPSSEGVMPSSEGVMPSSEGVMPSSGVLPKLCLQLYVVFRILLIAVLSVFALKSGSPAVLE